MHHANLITYNYNAFLHKCLFMLMASNNRKPLLQQIDFLPQCDKYPNIKNE